MELPSGNVNQELLTFPLLHYSSLVSFQIELIHSFGVQIVDTAQGHLQIAGFGGYQVLGQQFNRTVYI